MHEENHGFGDFLLGMLVGGLVGYVAALMYAPRAGEETRRMLTERGQELKYRAADTVQSTVDKTGKLVSEGRQRVTATVEDTLDQTRGRVRDLQERGSEVVNTVRNQASDRLHRTADQVDPDTMA